MTAFRLGELFCGAGGLALGASWAGAYNEQKDNDLYLEHTWAIDVSEAACETYRYNLCPDRPESVICADVRELDLAKLPAIDAFAFGFPCNDFSQVGEQKGFDGAYGPLYSYGVTVLKAHQPLFFVAENVAGLLSAQDGRNHEKIFADLKACGYRLYEHLYRFEKYGIPQKRHRVIIVGIRDDLPFEFKVPDPKPFASCDVTVRKALSGISEHAYNHEIPKIQARVRERLHFIKPGENAFTARLPPELRLKVRGATISQIYKRLDPDRPAYTVTAGGGGGTAMYHYADDRALTNREKARLQTFPDGFKFLGNRTEVRSQIGMAVPPLGAKLIFDAILQAFKDF